MALSTSPNEREYDKFVEDGSGNVAIRVVGVPATIGVGAGISQSPDARENEKFIEDGSGDVAVLFTN